MVFECKMRAAVRGTAIKTQGFTRTSQTCCDIRIQQLSASLQTVRWEFCEIEWPPRANRSGRWAPQPANCGGRQPVVETLYRKHFVLGGPRHPYFANWHTLIKTHALLVFEEGVRKYQTMPYQETNKPRLNKKQVPNLWFGKLELLFF